MAGFGGGFGGGNIQREFEQERIGFGPQGFGMYEEDVQINRNPFTGAMSIVKEDEFIPMGGGGNMRNMGNIQQEFEQERIGFGPQGFGMYEEDVQINRNPFTGATTIVKEDEFIPMGGGGNMGNMRGGGNMGYMGGGGNMGNMGRGGNMGNMGGGGNMGGNMGNMGRGGNMGNIGGGGNMGYG